MGIFDRSAHGGRSHTSHESTVSSFTSFENGGYTSGPEEWEEHLLMAVIRETITKYRLQSAAHFDVAIDVKQAFRTDKVEITRNTKLNVRFIGFIQTESYVCRPVFRRIPGKKVYGPTGKVQIFDNSTGRFIPLIKFLHSRYPSYPDAVKKHHIQNWWAGNGKNFDWAALPTELKELVIQNCVMQPLTQSDQLDEKRKKWLQDKKKVQAPEFIKKLVGWLSLLWTSHQIRAITLRACFVGTADLGSYDAFRLAASTCANLANVLDHLGNFYQMVQSDSVPTDYTTSVLANCYKLHPKIYPHLGNYATLRHSLRKIHLNMNLHDSMRFFRMTVGGFGRFTRPGSMSYEVFEQLPHLKEISIRLPSKPRRGWRNEPRDGSPKMYDDMAPCPRLLHRVIYERIAELLSLYPRVKVSNFVDEYEEARYESLRRAAIAKRKWTATDLEEMYAECGGGIELEELVQPGSWLHEDEDMPRAELEVQRQTIEENTQQPFEEFFPPKCWCDVPCRELEVFM